MQLFRSQLSRFTPHPHHDSWMRNHNPQWLNLLRWCSFFTLGASGWMTYFHQSPIGEIFELDKVINQWMPALNSYAISYIMLGIAIFLGLAGIASFRCGLKKNTKCKIPVIIAGLILIATLVLYLCHSGFSFFKVTSLLLPVSTPFLLIRYAGWRSQLDRWSILVCVLISITIGGYAFLSLKSTVGILTYTGDLLKLSDLSSEQVKVITSTGCYLSLFAAIALFISSMRRLALYMGIILGIIAVTCSAMSAYYSSTCYSISLSLFLLSYWVFPSLVLLSLASRKKSRTLRI